MKPWKKFLQGMCVYNVDYWGLLILLRVSLKTSLGIADVERLLSEVRSRVERRSEADDQRFRFVVPWLEINRSFP